MTLEEAKALKTTDVLLHKSARNADGTPERWRVNGKVHTWKTRRDQVTVPLKRGLKQYGYLTEADLTLFEKEL